MTWEAVVGLEIHAQLATRTKIFSGAPTNFGAEPNRQACAIDLGLPGVLPVINEEVLRMAVLFGLATNARIESRSVFARKNYFYPDLPKGYQISQYEHPIVQHGRVDIPLPDGSTKAIRITRAHLEEDAGKSLHDAYPGETGVDLNRSGVPLLEIVSAPDIRSAQEAATYMRTIHTLVRYLGICDGNMQEGSFRCDANVSVRQSGNPQLGTRTEVKNLNSFRYVARAITYEIQRQIERLENNQTITRETRHYDASTGTTRPMRQKELENDYRYFPDPDLLPIELTVEYIERIRLQLPELPAAKSRRFRTEYDLSHDDARILTGTVDFANFYETVAKASQQPKLTAQWMIRELTAALHRDGLNISQCPISPDHLTTLVTLLADGILSRDMAKQVFEATWRGEGNPDTIIAKRGLTQVSDIEAIDKLVEQIIAEHPSQAAQFRAGKKKILGFFVGKLMQITNRQANPTLINQALVRRLKSTKH